MENKKMNGRIIFGSILILMGIVFFLGQFEIFFIDGIWNFWPLIIIGMGVYQLMTNKNSLKSAIFLMLIGVVFQLSMLDIVSFWGAFWPLMIIFMGFNLIYKSKKFETYEPDLINEVNFETIFSGRKSKVVTDNFTGGVITATFGGAEIDLRSSTLAPEGATLELNCWFGGIEIYVPEDCNVIVTGSPVFGGIENKTYNKSSSNVLKPNLILKCSVGFGGIEIKN